MKTKFLFLAATLLMSANLFAQTNGDVNESGTVDAVDIASVIDVMQNAGGVAILPTSVKLDKSTYGFGIGMEVTLVPTIMPDNTTENALTWSSSNPSVASVTQEGVITGVAEGTTTITATTVNGKKAACEVTVSSTVYFWYVGQTDPSTMTAISPIVNDDTSPGWRLIGTTLPTYNISNKLWDGSIISTGTTKTTNYVALPNNTLFMYDSLGHISDALWIPAGTTEINGVTYYIYSSVANLKSFTNNIY